MRVVVVDDDKYIVDYICDIMNSKGYPCIKFFDGMNFLAALRRDMFDLLILDWFLPDIDGLDLLKRAKLNSGGGMGIVMLTNQSDKGAIVDALSAGADDYIVKPETASVILARSEAVFRRLNRTDISERHADFGGYVFDSLDETVSFSGQSARLSGKEFALARLLFDHIGRPLSRGYILETVWHADPNLSTRTLDMHISKIRAKLNLRPENGFRLAAITGYGYRLERFDRGR